MEVTVKFGLFCHPMEIRSSAPDLHYIIKRPTMINFDHQILANGWCVLHSYLLPIITFDFESDESDDKRRWRRRCIISFNSRMSRAASVTMKALLPLENSIKCKTIYIHQLRWNKLQQILMKHLKNIPEKHVKNTVKNLISTFSNGG